MVCQDRGFEVGSSSEGVLEGGIEVEGVRVKGVVLEWRVLE